MPSNKMPDTLPVTVCHATEAAVDIAAGVTHPPLSTGLAVASGVVGNVCDKLEDAQPLWTLPGDPPIYADVVGVEFALKVVRMAKRLKVEPDWLMAVMHFETGGTFSPSVRNPHSRAVGLIQFTTVGASAVGSTRAILSGMTALEQLDAVERYLRPYAGRARSLHSLYMCILWPNAVSRGDDFVLFRGKSAVAYRANRALDRNDDGAVTRREACVYVDRAYARGVERRESFAPCWKNNSCTVDK